MDWAVHRDLLGTLSGSTGGSGGGSGATAGSYTIYIGFSVVPFVTYIV